jgi:hypothetical protein
MARVLVLALPAFVLGALSLSVLAPTALGEHAWRSSAEKSTGRPTLHVNLWHVHEPPPSSLTRSWMARFESAGRAVARVVTVRHRVLASSDRLAYRAHAVAPPVAFGARGAHAASVSLSIGPGFPGLSDNGSYPADAQIAVGPSDVVEMTNTRVGVYTRTGIELRVFPMSQILAQNNSDEMSDPQIAWDPTSQRWIAAGMDLTTSQTDVAISDGTDPLGAWEAYGWSYGTSACPDQPRLGFSSLVVIVATELFSGDCHQDRGSATGATVLVIDKAAMLAATSPGATQYGPDPTYDNFVPVQMLAPSTMDFAASTDSGTSTAVHVLTSQGVPPNDTITEQDTLLIAPLQDPGTNGSERGGGLVDAGDDRLNDATWANDTLYLAADDQCTYPSDPYLETCVRVMEISTAVPQPTLTGENDVGWSSADAYYGALRPDSHGNAIIVFDYSGPRDWPSVAVTAALGPIQGEQGGTFTDSVILAEGTSPTADRWGDYSGAAIDPTNPDVIWTAGQVADNFGDQTAGAPYRWATHIDAASVTAALSALPNEVYPGWIYRGRTSQRQRIQIRPSGGGAHIYNAWATVHMPCRRDNVYLYDTFQIPNETRKAISNTGWFSTSARYGADRYAHGYWFSINGRFVNSNSVSGTLRAGASARLYGRCASGPVRYSAHT